MKTILIYSCNGEDIIRSLIELQNHTLLINCNKNITNELDTYKEIDLLIIIPSELIASSLFISSDWTSNSVIKIKTMIIIFEEKKQCNVNMMKFFFTTLRMNINSAYLICFDYNFIQFDQIYKVYTYNMYMNYAPPPWSAIIKFKPTNPRFSPIEIFFRNYTEGE